MHISTADNSTAHCDDALIATGFIRWLKVCLALLLCMVLIGGLTRLTESGLSIVEWKLVSGILPPLSAESWQAEFVAYQATPEYMYKNNYMEISDFKRIFWLEYLHRLLGRLIGLVFIVPLLYYTLRRNIVPARYVHVMWGVTCMIGLQGAVGWYMVKSGLVLDPWVSPYRLAFHLMLATIICAATFAILQSARYHATRVTVHITPFSAWGVLILIASQIIYGAFVAGLDAGYVYNDFPLMNGSFLPPDQWQLSPWYYNLTADIATVQFVHRWWAFIVLSAIIWQAVRSRQRSAYIVAFIAVVQLLLGIATLMSMVQIALASVHQLVAIILVLAQTHHMLSIRWQKSLPSVT